MPKVYFRGEEIPVELGENLRDALLRADRARGPSKHRLTPHNDGARMVNCLGLGTCGTCAVQVRGADDSAPLLSAPTARERWRLTFPPHDSPPSDSAKGMRLACQARVQGDVHVRKFAGFWGPHTEDSAEDFPEEGNA